MNYLYTCKNGFVAGFRSILKLGWEVLYKSRWEMWWESEMTRNEGEMGGGMWV